jgi:hypothetical protein
MGRSCVCGDGEAVRMSPPDERGIILHQVPKGKTRIENKRRLKAEVGVGGRVDGRWSMVDGRQRQETRDTGERHR